MNASRRREYENLLKLKVFVEVPEQHARGKKKLRSRWVDRMKTDDFFGVIGTSRIVIQDFATSARSDVFTATPPLMGCRLVVALAASKRQRYPPWSRLRPSRIQCPG